MLSFLQEVLSHLKVLHKKSPLVLFKVLFTLSLGVLPLVSQVAQSIQYIYLKVDGLPFRSWDIADATTLLDFNEQLLSKEDKEKAN